MLLETCNTQWDFELLDTGDGFRLERWGQAILQRPDPQIIWNKSLPETEWQKASAIFRPGLGNDSGTWSIVRPLPKPWTVSFRGVTFCLKLTPFKHTGLFAEQAAQWQWATDLLKQGAAKKAGMPKILNLFAYTGGASMVLAKAGCQVTHVDASKPAITWANENHAANGLPEHAVRWILDDCVKFVKREVKRGATYDGIIMDPPAFGHSPSGKTWKFNRDLPPLLADCVKLLSDHALFLILNGYATNSSALALQNVMEDAFAARGGSVTCGELCLSQKIRRPTAADKKNIRVVSTGIFARWRP